MSWKGNIFFLIGSLGIADTIVVSLIEGVVNIGILLPALCGIIFIWCGLVEVKLLNYPQILDNRIVKKLLIFGFIAWLISFILIETLIFSAATGDSIPDYDYLIVLGGGVVGNKATSVLEQRLERSIEYIKENPNLKKIIVSGGQGPLAEVTEAQVMKDFLLRNGVAENKILVEGRASSTMENFKFSKVILGRLRPTAKHKVIVITSEFHLWRAKFLAARNGMKAKGIAAQTPNYILPNLMLREYLAVIKSYIWDRN